MTAVSQSVTPVPCHPGWFFGAEFRHASHTVRVAFHHEDGRHLSVSLMPDELGRVSTDRKVRAASLHIDRLEAAS